MKQWEWGTDRQPIYELKQNIMTLELAILNYATEARQQLQQEQLQEQQRQKKIQ